MVETPGSASQMNCTSRAANCKFSINPCSFQTSSNFVAQLIGWIWIWDSNTQCRIWDHVNCHPDQFCCWINSAPYFSWPTKCVPVLQDLQKLYCIFAIDQYFYLSLHRLYQMYQILRAWKLSISILFEVCVILCKPRWSPQAVARKLAPSRNVEQENSKIGMIFTKFCSCTVQ